MIDWGSIFDFGATCFLSSADSDDREVDCSPGAVHGRFQIFDFLVKTVFVVGLVWVLFLVFKPPAHSSAAMIAPPVVQRPTRIAPPQVRHSGSSRSYLAHRSAAKHHGKAALPASATK